MFHLNTELLIDYWRGRRGERAVPARSDIDPAAFFALTPQAFIAVREPDAAFRFRLAGEAVIDLHGRALRGSDVLDLWRPGHRQPLARGLDAALDNASFLVVSATAPGGPDETVRLEILFAPLTGSAGVTDRFLGLYQLLRPRPPLQNRPIEPLAIHGLNGVDANPKRPGLRLAALDGRRIA